MLILLSPSKTMDMTPAAIPEYSQPVFLGRSAKLVEVLREFSIEQLMGLMDISAKLAELNGQRFADWELPFTPETAKQALFAFSGDVYEGLAAESLTAADVKFAGEHVRMLSGLYGLLQPLDLIMPYRLEMGRKLAVGDAKNLYEFWRKTITEELNRSGEAFVLNLASQEYFKAVDRRALKATVITPVFKDEKNGKLKVISFYAKRARGQMARFVIQNRMEDPAGLLAFSEEGYAYKPELSSATEPVFARAERADH